MEGQVTRSERARDSTAKRTVVPDKELNPTSSRQTGDRTRSRDSCSLSQSEEEMCKCVCTTPFIYANCKERSPVLPANERICITILTMNAIETGTRRSSYATNGKICGPPRVLPHRRTRHLGSVPARSGPSRNSRPGLVDEDN
jgi:hypothetical protein